MTRKQLLFLASVLQEPLSCLIPLLPIVLIKQLHATALHISVLTALAPTVAILSFYWGTRGGALVASTVWAAGGVLIACVGGWGAWAWVAASTCYTLFWRGGNPARMELIKRLCGEEQERVYARLMKVQYGVGMALGPLFGWTIDRWPDQWQWVMGGAALLYALAGWVYRYLGESEREEARGVVAPWREAWALLRAHKGFARFQAGFFLAGFGLMLAKPASDLLLGGLEFGYCELFVGKSLVQGAAMLIAARWWSERLRGRNLLQVSSWVGYGFVSYVLLLAGAVQVEALLFAACCCYGVAQAGSHLVWNLSGPLLSGDGSSHKYSAVNVLAVGVRGCIAPVVGGMVASGLGLVPALLSGGVLMLAGAAYLQIGREKLTQELVS